VQTFFWKISNHHVCFSRQVNAQILVLDTDECFFPHLFETFNNSLNLFLKNDNTSSTHNNQTQKFGFSKRLHFIIPFLSDKWPNQNEPKMKKILKTKFCKMFLLNLMLNFEHNYFYHHDPLPYLMDKLKLTGWNLGWVCNSSLGLACIGRAIACITKLTNFKLKTQQKQLLGSLPIAFMIPAQLYFKIIHCYS